MGASSKCLHKLEKVRDINFKSTNCEKSLKFKIKLSFSLDFWFCVKNFGIVCPFFLFIQDLNFGLAFNPNIPNLDKIPFFWWSSGPLLHSSVVLIFL